MTKTYPKEISTCFHCFRAERGDPCGMSRVGRAHGDGRRVRPSRCRVYIFLKVSWWWRSSPAAWPPAALEPHLRPLWQSPRKDSSSRCRFPWGGIWIGSPFENLSSIGTFYQYRYFLSRSETRMWYSDDDNDQRPRRLSAPCTPVPPASAPPSPAHRPPGCCRLRHLDHNDHLAIWIVIIMWLILIGKG